MVANVFFMSNKKLQFDDQDFCCAEHVFSLCTYARCRQTTKKQANGETETEEEGEEQQWRRRKRKTKRKRIEDANQEEQEIE